MTHTLQLMPMTLEWSVVPKRIREFLPVAVTNLSDIAAQLKTLEDKRRDRIETTIDEEWVKKGLTPRPIF